MGRNLEEVDRMRKIIRRLVTFVILLTILYIVLNKADFSPLENILLDKEVITTEEDLIEHIRDAMLNYEENIEIKYIGNYDKIKTVVENPLDYVCEIDDEFTSSDYDYLKYNFESMTVQVKGYGTILNIRYNFSYRESKEETKVVDEKIKEVFKELKIENLSEYEKIKAIHDYIITNSSYDRTYEKATAYDNLIEQSSVCQGYAALTYKMMVEAGIPCRIINGMGAGDTHAWNIVYLEGKWYNIDCTWDDPMTAWGEDILQYTYFLKSDGDFKDHQRDEEYLEEKFLKEYTIAETSYHIK